MGRWTQYDEDEYRLPEGMQRVGYDADSGKYYFRDKNGTLWEGAEGAAYGEMRPVSDAPIAVSDPDEHAGGEEDLEAAPRRADGYQPLAVDPSGASHSYAQSANIHAYRMMFPFFLLIAVALLLVIRLVYYRSSADPSPPDVSLCAEGSEPAVVVPGDTCWKLWQTRNSTLQEILNFNPGIDCDHLLPGQSICLPKVGYQNKA